MGIQLKGNDEYLTSVDVDNRNGTMVMWQSLIQRHQQTLFRTPTATTGKNGLHYLFKVSNEQLQQMQSAHTGLTIDGIKYDIDAKARNGWFLPLDIPQWMAQSINDNGSKTASINTTS